MNVGDARLLEESVRGMENDLERLNGHFLRLQILNGKRPVLKPPIPESQSKLT
jgi:hypothetical protein